MAEPINKINISAIFYEMLKKGELSKKSDVYKQMNNDHEAIGELEAMASDFDCQIIHGQSALFLAPDADNTFLGYSRTELRNALKANDSATYYLYMFIFLVMLHEFYATEYGGGRTRDFIQLGILMNKVDEALRKGKAAEDKKENLEADIPFSEMYAKYNNLKADTSNKRDKTTKRSLYERLFRFLESQNLIHWFEKEDEVRPRRRLNEMFDIVLRSEAGHQTVMRMLERIENA